MLIKKAAVIGAGTMGTGIATHLASAGVDCLLLDIVPRGAPPAGASGAKAAAERSKLAREALDRAAKAKPPYFQQPADRAWVEFGNLEDDVRKLGECDWIVEAVTEDLEVKRRLFAQVAKHRRRGSIVSSNTSGLALHLLAKGLDEDFRRHFLVTHFFNPPRYMYLLEVVQGADTLPDVVAAVSEFAELRLGKGVVACKDTPNFIANRIGVFAMGAACKLMIDSGLSIEEVDAVTGPAMGRPKTATFRLHDLVGIDVALMVMDNVKKLVPHDESLQSLEAPPFLRRMVQEGKLGAKSGAGFYKKQGGDILVLDLGSFAYRPQREPSFASLEASKRGRTAAERLRLLVGGNDPGARFAWKLLSETILYSARRVPEIADDIVSVDRALRWGFNWELGPFEIWDALGVKDCVRRLQAEGRPIPAIVERLLSGGYESFYSRVGVGAERRLVYFDLASADRRPVPPRPGVVLLDDVRERQQPLRSNRAASLWDLGDRVLGLEFHSKMNTISGETLDLVLEAVDVVESGDWAGLVVGNQAPNFSAGANLADMAAAAAEKKWDAVTDMIRRFHRSVLRLRYCARPVVAAVQGLALGGGCEIPMACHRVQAAAETYMGLVELGVGLIPAGGGSRELACRAAEAVPAGVDADFFAFLKRSFEVVAKGTTSTSAVEARNLGFLRDCDGVSMNRDHVLADAKRLVLHLAQAGLQPPRPRREVRVAGAPGLAELEVILHQYREGGFVTEYDAFLARRLGYVLCGGEIDAENTVSEEYLLDLEREVFIGLVAEPKTQERIAHMLKTGKPLRN
jgi:3-hydroxyacyl-CoA dehydrogenase